MNWAKDTDSDGAECLEASVEGSGLTFGRDEMRAFICVASRVGDATA